MAKYKTPNKFIYKAIYYTYGRYYRLKHRINLDQSRCLRRIKGPAIILSTHTSFWDFIHICFATYPTMPIFVANRVYSQTEPSRTLFSWVRVIPKYLFTPDSQTIKQIFGAIKHNQVLAMMPEARRSSCGASFPIADGTAQLIKKLAVDVYAIHTQGGYFAHPKWSDVPRRAAMNIVAEKLYDGNQLAQLTVEQIEDYLGQKMAYRDDRALLPLRACKDRTKGLDGLLYLCPNCMRQFTLSAQNNTVKCTECGYEVYMDSKCTFTSGQFETVTEWYEFQKDALCREMDIMSEPLSMSVTVKKIHDKKHRRIVVGEAVCTLDKDRLTLFGTIEDKEYKYTIPTDKLEGLPFACAKRVDIVIGGQAISLYPKENVKQCVKWSMFADILTERRRAQVGQCQDYSKADSVKTAPNSAKSTKRNLKKRSKTPKAK